MKLLKAVDILNCHLSYISKFQNSLLLEVWISGFSACLRNCLARFVCQVEVYFIIAFFNVDYFTVFTSKDFRHQFQSTGLNNLSHLSLRFRGDFLNRLWFRRNISGSRCGSSLRFSLWIVFFVSTADFLFICNVFLFLNFLSAWNLRSMRSVHGLNNKVIDSSHWHS